MWCGGVSEEDVASVYEESTPGYHALARASKTKLIAPDATQNHTRPWVNEHRRPGPVVHETRVAQFGGAGQKLPESRNNWLYMICTSRGVQWVVADALELRRRQEPRTRATSPLIVYNYSLRQEFAAEARGTKGGLFVT